jgi:hypothetical protein
MRGCAVQFDLTDDDLLRAIADNTDDLSALIEEQMQLKAASDSIDPDTRARLTHFTVERIEAYQRDYRQFTAEIRRRTGP